MMVAFSTSVVVSRISPVPAWMAVLLHAGKVPVGVFGCLGNDMALKAVLMIYRRKKSVFPSTGHQMLETLKECINKAKITMAVLFFSCDDLERLRLCDTSFEGPLAKGKWFCELIDLFFCLLLSVSVCLFRIYF